MTRSSAPPVISSQEWRKPMLQSGTRDFAPPDRSYSSRMRPPESSPRWWLSAFYRRDSKSWRDRSRRGSKTGVKPRLCRNRYCCCIIADIISRIKALLRMAFRGHRYRMRKPGWSSKTIAVTAYQAAFPQPSSECYRTVIGSERYSEFKGAFLIDLNRPEKTVACIDVFWSRGIRHSLWAARTAGEPNRKASRWGLEILWSEQQVLIRIGPAFGLFHVSLRVL